jgi:uncharacterized protein Usg
MLIEQELFKKAGALFLLPQLRLTTAEIFYHLPDFPKLLQSYVWQEMDHAPDFPILRKFLKFWESHLDGRLHSVNVSHSDHHVGNFSFADADLQV